MRDLRAHHLRVRGDGIINRQVYAQIPQKVEYSLTPLGETLKPILETMHEWGVQRIIRKFLKNLVNSRH